GIAYEKDDLFDEESYTVNMLIENNLTETIEIQAHEVSADGVMIDDQVFFSETVAGEKQANAKLKIENYDGDLAELNESLEFKLIIIGEDWDTIEETNVSIEIK